MRKHRILAVAVCASLLAVIGCKGKTVTLITAQGNTVQAAQDGQVLEWRMLPSSIKIKSFEVQFLGANPCGANQPPIIGYPNKPAHCRVSTSTPGGYVFYQYKLIVDQYDTNATAAGASGREGKKGDFPFRVVSCGACGLLAGGSTSNDTSSEQSSAPITKPESESSEASSKNMGGNPFVVLDCVQNNVTVTPPDWDSSPVQWYAGGSIQSDWSITFDSSSPCAEKPPFNSGNNTCTTDAATPGKYSYTVHADKCSQTPGAGTVTVH
jgi:hypothetical protein